MIKKKVKNQSKKVKQNEYHILNYKKRIHSQSSQ